MEYLELQRMKGAPKCKLAFNLATHTSHIRPSIILSNIFYYYFFLIYFLLYKFFINKIRINNIY